MVAVPLGPAPVDITGVRAGDLNEFRITITAGGRAVDLTDQTITAQAKRNKSDATGLDAEITVADDATTGVLTVRWPGDEVRTWLGTSQSLSGVWDLQMKEGTSDPVTVMAGSFSAEMDVTR